MKKNPFKIASELSGMSIEVIIQKLNLSKAQLKEYQEDVDNIPYGVLVKLSKISGVSLSKFSEEPNLGPELCPTYVSQTQEINDIIEQKWNSVNQLYDKYVELEDREVLELLDKIKNKFANTEKTVRYSIRKPLVCAFGNSDTGKSTLINYFLREEVALVDYTPLTSAIVYYYHSLDMPKHLKNLNANAFVFGSENNKKRNYKFQHEYIYDEKKCKKYLISSGNLKDILKEYSARTGTNYQDRTYKIAEIVVFLDIDILKEVSFIDIPGFGSNDTQDDVGLTLKMDEVDILFYLSIANGFMRGTDLANLSKIIERRKTAKAVYVLATHADAVGSPISLQAILDTGYQFLIDTFSDNQKRRLQEEKELLKEQFLPFDTGNELYCTTFNSKLETFIPNLIKEKTTIAKETLANACKCLNREYSDEMREIRQNQSSEKKNKDAEVVFIQDRKKELEIKKIQLKYQIEELRKESIDIFKENYNRMINKDYIVHLLQKKEIKNKQKDIEKFSAYLSNEIGDFLTETLGDKSKKLSDTINAFLQEYKQSWSQTTEEFKPVVNFSGFDFQRAFATGLTGVTTYGALALWATIVAEGSNLGAYILVSKVVSSLSAIGISLGGTSAVATAIASMGGPVVLGIAIAGIFALSMFGLFSGNWRTRLAKEIVNAYEKQKFQETYIEQINKHWDETIVALDKCLDSLEDNLLDYYHTMNTVRERLNKEEDSVLYDAIMDIYQVTCDIYQDIYMKFATNAEDAKNIVYMEQMKDIASSLELLKDQKCKYEIVANENDFESIIFLNGEERTLFWNDMKLLLNEKISDLISLTENAYIYRNKPHYSIYFEIKENQCYIRYIDTIPAKKDNYDKYKKLIRNTFSLKNDQLKYKIFDMIEQAEKEILILMPWINEYGWSRVGYYEKSVEQAIVEALTRNSHLKIKVMVGYDRSCPDNYREEETRQMAKKIIQKYSQFSDRLAIYTDIGSHEKKIVIDNVCALDGSYNLLSNSAPYQERMWASESMTVIEYPDSIERQRREILDRAGIMYYQI